MTISPQIFCRFIDTLAINVREVDVGTGLDERFRNGGTNALRRAGDQNHPIRKICIYQHSTASNCRVSMDCSRRPCSMS